MELLQNTLYINLDHRVDRLQHVNHQLSLLQIKGERMKAVQMVHGHIGCTMSHIKCLELAITKGWDYVFICEDDITFTNPKTLLDSLSAFYQDKTVNWDVLIIGGNDRTKRDRSSNLKYCKVTNCQTTTGYIVKKHYMATLLENFQNGLKELLNNPKNRKIYAIDMHWKLLQNIDNWYILLPKTVCQIKGYSDIEKREVNYSRVMLR